VAQVKFISSMVDWLAQASNEIGRVRARVESGVGVGLRLESMLE
jgi:hypothetical protein